VETHNQQRARFIRRDPDLLARTKRGMGGMPFEVQVTEEAETDLEWTRRSDVLQSCAILRVLSKEDALRYLKGKQS